MSELSSCYFCGSALDAPVERYPLTPPSVDADTGRSVTLCPTCRRKLVKALEVVAGEFGAVSEAAAEDPDAAVAATETDAEADEADEQTRNEAGDVDAADAERAEPDASGDEAAASEDDDGIESEDAELDAEADAETAETAADEGQSDAVGDPSASEDGEADPVGDDAAADSIDDDAAAEPADDGGAAGDEKPDLLSTPAAQKVIKLLQNREFPLDREEFEVVASNAYDIPMRDCRDVIDTLVAEGYVAEDGGRLVRPE